MKKKHGFFIMYLILFLLFAYRYFPTVIFYFDQTEGIATITGANGHEVNFEYNHQEIGEKFHLTSDVRDIRKVRKLNKGDKIPILYSKKYYHLVSLRNLDGKPNLGGLILLIICALPVVFINKLGFDEE